MITFGHPMLLLLLAAPLLLAVWEVTRPGVRLALPLDHGGQPARTWLGRIVTGANLLPALLLAVAVLLLARPLRSERPEQERKLTNIEFVLDVSGSMTARFGLTIFGNEVLRWTPVTRDLSVIRNATPFLRPELLPDHFRGTEIGKALRFCRNTLREQAEGDALIVLLSDGQSADLGPEVSRQIGGDLASDDIRLYAVHIGESQPPADLYQLCGPTEGEVFAARNPEALQAVFDYIDRMQPVEMKPAAPHNVDAFGPFALLGLSLLGCYGIALFGLRYTPW